MGHWAPPAQAERKVVVWWGRRRREKEGRWCFQGEQVTHGHCSSKTETSLSPKPMKGVG